MGIWNGADGQYIAELRKEIDETRNKIASGEQPIFDAVDALFDRLDGKN